MMKMKFSFIKNAVLSAFLLLFFVCVGSNVSAQSFNMDGSQSIPALKEYSGSFLDKADAVIAFQAEFDGLNSSVPNGGIAEATHSVKKEFILSAVMTLKMDGTVETALTTAYYKAVAVSSNMAVSVDNDAILTYYADMLSN